MCGIAAVLGATPAAEAEQSVRSMLHAQLHRGPDHGGWLVVPMQKSVLALGNRRLAIQDVSPLGQQPMRNQETGDILVYNGEIYNAPQLKTLLKAEGYCFRGHSDTEVLLRAYERWGVGCIDRLRGMFAFALWDARRSRLVIARDHLGIKPLYYSSNKRGFACASETRALVKSGLVDSDLDPRSLATYLAYGGVQEPLTIYKSILSLPRGSWKELDADGQVLAEGRYWHFPPVLPSTVLRPLPDLLEEGRALIHQAVGRHLVSDVPLGIFLSSGLDSTAILGFSTRQDRLQPLDAFTISFPDQPQYDEREIARASAVRFSARYHECPISDSTAVGWIGDALECMDQPSMDGFNTYIAARAIREQGIVVALSGLGGDEVFGGYDLFRRVPRVYDAMSWLSLLPLAARVTVARLASLNSTGVGRHKAEEIASSDSGLIGMYFHHRRLVSNSNLRKFGLDAKSLGLSEDFQLPELRYEDSYVSADHIASIGRLETAFYLENLLLRDSDVFGMANSLEVRVPFLDRDLVDWTLRLPGDVLLPKKTQLKHLLRKICAGLYTRPQVDQPKRGFVLPLSTWLKGPLREMMEENLRSLGDSGLLERAGIEVVRKLFEDEPDGPAWSRMWALVTLGHWLQAHAGSSHLAAHMEQTA